MRESSPSCRRAPRLVAAQFIASVCLLWTCHAEAQSLPEPAEPWLAEAGDWAADFNGADRLLLGIDERVRLDRTSDRVLMDTFLYEYGRTCGGRVDLRQIRQANLSCTEVFPGND